MVRERSETKIRLPGLVIDTRRCGTIRYRVRVEGRKWERITLPVPPSDPTFMEYYLSARRGVKIEPPKPRSEAPTVIPRSLAWLTLEFEDWMEARVRAGQLHQNTLKQRRMFYERLRAGHGNKDMRMPRSGLVTWRDSMLDTPGAADNMIKAMRACYAWAIERGLVTTNPAVGIDKANRGTGAIAWSVDDLRQYRAFHPVGTMAHLALSLFTFTACRISDACMLGREDETLIQGIRHLDWQPRKKGSARVTIPILPPLEKAIDSVSVIGPTYLLNGYDRPFASSSALGNKFRDWVREAGLENRSSHGIRKAAGELMALEGATQYHIMAVHGHTQAKTSEIYTSGVNRQRLAAEAMHLLGKMDW